MTTFVIAIRALNTVVGIGRVKHVLVGVGKVRATRKTFIVVVSTSPFRLFKEASIVGIIFRECSIPAVLVPLSFIR